MAWAGAAAAATLEPPRFCAGLPVDAGVDARTASAEACRMEHCLSEDSFRKLSERLAPETGAA